MAKYFWMWPVIVPKMIGGADGLLSEYGEYTKI